MKTNKQQIRKTPRSAYAGFLFQTFFKRPFGYIIPCLYVVYLGIILLLVPKIIKTGPLFIWTVGGFNMPVFNLFFIAAAAAALAVSIFRTGREDGTELCLSSKPLTKGSMVAMKVLVYLIIMVCFAAIANIITLLTQPLFGWYNDVFNTKGITVDQYIGLNLSVLVGNIINMLLFGGIAVLISMVGGQVITMVSTVGLVFLMCLMNFIYPQVVTSSLEVLRNKYDAEILTYSMNTLDQYESQDSSGPKQFATIACTTDEYGEEKTHFDTHDYWVKAERESGGTATNYIDIARQLSSLYNAFGLDESKLKEASKLSIGMNRGYKYTIDQASHITTKENQDALKYPIAFYGMTTSQGFQYPQVIMVGGDMTIDKQNWYAWSVINAYDFAACSFLTNKPTGLSIVFPEDPMREEYKRLYFKMNELYLDKETRRDVTDALYDQLVDAFKKAVKDNVTIDNEFFSDEAIKAIVTTDGSGRLYDGQYAFLTAQQQHYVVSKAHLAWAIKAQQNQINDIKKYCAIKGIEDEFPFKSSTVLDWYKENAETKSQSYYAEQLLGNYILGGSIQVRYPIIGATDVVKGYDRLVISRLSYAETYSNLYEYHVSNFYTIANVMAFWSIVAALLFAGSVVVYKKIDLK